MTEYIEREAVNALIKAECSPKVAAYLIDAVAAIPAADVREVVLCKDCEYWQSDCGWCGYFDIGMNVNDFCSRGKREES